MPRYSVQIPVTGSIIVTVEAADETAAQEAAWDKAGFRIMCDDEDAEAGEFESHDKVAYGNVCAAVCNEINVEQID